MNIVDKPIILTVDDNHNNKNILHNILTPLYQVIEANTGAECLQEVANLPVDLILINHISLDIDDLEL